MKKKDLLLRKRPFAENVAFCSTCGSQLDDFWMNPESKDPQLAKERSEWCKKQGRFIGDVCSKQFIASSSILIPPLTDEEDE
jgi:hypothetical protein